MKNQIIIRFAAGLCFITAGVLFILAKAGINAEKQIELSQADSLIQKEETTGCAETEADSIFVHVCGAVESPGIYELPAGSRIGDAIEAAGGFSEEADRDYLNLAETLTDSRQVRAPTFSEAQESLKAARSDGLININTANAEALMTLPGIGEAKAQAIISYREEQGGFSSAEDIMRVPGIKEAAFSRIKDKIKVDG